MKTELAMGLIAKVAARDGEHGGKGKPAKTGGFDEALAARIDATVEKRMPQDRRADRADETRPQWRIGGLGRQLAFAMPQAKRSGDDAPTLHDDLQELIQPARDEPETADDRPALTAVPPSERDEPEMPEDGGAIPAIAQGAQSPRPVRDDAVPAPRTTPAVAPVVASDDATTAEPPPQRPRGEQAQTARPAPAIDAVPRADGNASGEKAAPREQAASAAALTAGADAAIMAAGAAAASPPTRTTRVEPSPEPAAGRRQPASAAYEPATGEARPATPQPEGTPEQRTLRPAPAPIPAPTATATPAPAPAAPGVAAAPRPEARAADRAGAPAPQAAEPAQPRVTVLGVNTATPAPVMPVQLNPTAAGLVATIEREPTWRAAAEAASSAAQRGQGQGQGSISTLRIQLNPAELGMVTARLTVAGPQLEIEIRVESNDARQRLAADSDAIVKALRAIGFDIDKVTIQQAPQTGGPAPQQGGQGRDSFLNGQDQQRADANAGGRNGQGSESGGGAGRHRAGETAAERLGGGVYI